MAVEAVDIMRDKRALNHMDPDTKAVHLRLEAWGVWAHSHEVQAWPEMSVIGRMMKYGTLEAAHHTRAPISMPDEIAAVDAAVARLGDIDKRAIIAYYTHWEAVEATAKRTGMRVRQLYNVLRRARWRLSGMLDV